MYVKLFESIYSGTLRGRPYELLVFINLLAHADREGVVDIHQLVIAQETGLDMGLVCQALAILEAPDEMSRTPDSEGRRITRLDDHRDWGWQITNYVHYRQIRDADTRREQNRAAAARWRDRKRTE